MTTMPAETKAKTLGDRVYETLVDAIVTGKLPPGSRILEAELAQHYGVSRGPLREAIRRLEERRLVDRTAHIGTRVVALSNDVLMEIFVVREALEGMACRLAAERMSASELAGLAHLLQEHEAALKDQDVYYQRERDWDFHYRIVKGARNPTIESLLCGELYQLIKLYRYQHKSSPGRAQRALQEHRRIAGALLDRDCDLAEILMRRHIGAARRALDVKFGDNGSEAVHDGVERHPTF